MTPRLLGNSTKKLLRAILLIQLGVGSLLVVTNVGSGIALPGQQTNNLPSGPVSPGDQRRVYREDRQVPKYLTEIAPAAIPQLREFGEKLTFETHEIEGIGTVVLLLGAIGDGDTFRFRNFLAGLGTKPEAIAMNSPGGLVSEAISIGRHIRESDVGTVVLSGAVCLSSCPYMLAGGNERIVSQHAAIGLHQHYYDTQLFLPMYFAVEKIQTGQGETMEYLIEMGIDPSIMRFSLNTPPNEIYLLIADELEQTALATKFID